LAPTSTQLAALSNIQQSGGLSAAQFFLNGLQAVSNSAFISLNTSNVGFYTSDNTPRVTWNSWCQSTQLYPTPCAQTDWYIEIDEWAFLNPYIYKSCNPVSDSSTVCNGPDTFSALASSPNYTALIGRSFWPGAALATTYTPPNPPTSATTVPSAPTNVTVTAASARSVSVGFTPAPVSSKDLPVTYMAHCWDSVGAVPYDATSPISPITVTGLNPNTAYWCNVIPSNQIGQGTGSSGTPGAVTLPSPPTSTTPGTPTNVVWSTTPGWIDVNYVAPVNTGEGGITGYTATCSAAGYASCTAGPVSSSTFGIGLGCASLETGIPYQCSVVAQNGYGSSTPSVAQTVTALGAMPAAPTNFTVAPMAGAISLNWTAPSYIGTI
jgi:hypothetical protein